MTRLVFIDDRRQLDWVLSSLTFDGSTELIAFTADAVQALEERQVPHTPVSAFATLHALARADETLSRDCFFLLGQLERFIGDRYEPVRFEGPGLLTGNAYVVHYTITSIAIRAILMRAAIRAREPRLVIAFDDVLKWFAVDGYVRNPWLEVLERDSERDGFGLEIIRLEEEPAPAGTVWTRLATGPRTWLTRARRKALHIASTRSTHVVLPSEIAGLRLVFARSTGFDWGPVVQSLKGANGADCYKVSAWADAGQWWTTTFAPVLESMTGGPAKPLGLDLPGPRADGEETCMLSRLFDEWLGRQGARSLDVMGIDVLPALATQLRRMLTRGPALIRYADAFADRMLQVAQPHAFCFPSMPYIADHRVAFVCRQRNVPVVSYQHGLGYSVHVHAQDEKCDAAQADYFLTYGVGSAPRANPAVPPRARYVPVGSARVEQMRRSRSPVLRSSRRLRVLWAAEYYSGNTITTFLTEETGRYGLYKACLDTLSSSRRLRVTYRPHPVGQDGIVRWLRSDSRRRARVNTTDTFEHLVRHTDVAIVACSTSATVWAEVLGRGVPMVLYCDPNQSMFLPDFLADVERTCILCPSAEELVAAVDRLTNDTATFVAELGHIDTAPFLEKYVLHRGHCTAQAVSFLNDVCRHRRPVDEWERSA